MKLHDLEGVGRATERSLKAAGIFTLEHLAGLEADEAVNGISANRLAILIASAKEELANTNVEPEPGEDPGEPTLGPVARPIEFQYKKLTFRGLVGRPDVGELEIRKTLFKIGEPVIVPADLAKLILSRKQYLFDVEIATQ